MKKKLVIGILAHVDAGKTTLAESMLYLSGRTGRLGRVDNKDAYLDNYELERARGITIFSKQAVFEAGDLQITLLDTPGHVDFSAEMERTLQVLDYAVLVVSGADGVQGHTLTLWRLLELYRIPVFLFINKMDQPAADRERLIHDIKKQLDPSCIDFGQAGSESFFDQTDREAFFEQLAMCEESLMDAFLETGRIEKNQIGKAIGNRRVYPCYFGSALRLDGVEALMEGIAEYAGIPTYSDGFGAKIFKISRDEQGNRLTHMKITGGSLRVRDAVKTGDREEKVNQIRIYSGQKYESVNEINAGSVCAVTGLTQTKAGDGLGIEEASDAPVLEPVLSYQITLPEGIDPRAMLPKLRVLEEEAPELHIVWDEQLQEIQAEIMGEVQIEILQSLIGDRFGVAVTFDAGRIVYKETIAETVEGVGHFEPLRHYAEVHLLLAPGDPGSGIQIGTVCSEDVLGGNWQGSILSSLAEKEHKGVLTGSAVTDIKITLVSGRAHNKHTEGGDFREAACRAVRQGLMEAASVLLEPYYSFRLELPEKLVGKAMVDIEKMHGSCLITGTDGETAILSGIAPVAAMRNYQQEVTAYTKGLGRLSSSLMGYAPCGNAEEVISQIGYDPSRDPANLSSSVFCAGGSGFLVEWDEVKQHMHVEAFLKENKDASGPAQKRTSSGGSTMISQEEIEQIMNRTFYANQGKKSAWKRRIAPRERDYEAGISAVRLNGGAAPAERSKEPKEEYLLVDGYNVIHAWPELNELVDGNMDGARMKLIDSLSNYQGIRECQIIAVFDAYRVQGHREEVMDYHNIHLVFTREAQTADQYIEKFAHDNQKKYQITVATSDGMQQMIVRGAGCSLMSARELKAEIDDANENLMKEYRRLQGKERNALTDVLPPDVKRQLEELIENQ
jgi:small GTP-binding protein